MAELLSWPDQVMHHHTTGRVPDERKIPAPRRAFFRGGRLKKPGSIAKMVTFVYNVRNNM
jgi:hypothetical protein